MHTPAADVPKDYMTSDTALIYVDAAENFIFLAVRQISNYLEISVQQLAITEGEIRIRVLDASRSSRQVETKLSKLRLRWVWWRWKLRSDFLSVGSSSRDCQDRASRGVYWKRVCVCVSSSCARPTCWLMRWISADRRTWTRHAGCTKKLVQVRIYFPVGPLLSDLKRLTCGL